MNNTPSFNNANDNITEMTKYYVIPSHDVEKNKKTHYGATYQPLQTNSTIYNTNELYNENIEEEQQLNLKHERCAKITLLIFLLFGLLACCLFCILIALPLLGILMIIACDGCINDD